MVADRNRRDHDRAATASRLVAETWVRSATHFTPKKFFTQDGRFSMRVPYRPPCPARASSASFPFFGVNPVLITPEGAEIEGAGEGLLAIKGPWPSTIRGVVGDYDRYVSTYFPIEGEEHGYYLTGDGCRRDKDGYYWIPGRVDDVINSSGHRIGTAEVESAVVLHPDVAEAAV